MTDEPRTEKKPRHPVQPPAPETAKPLQPAGEAVIPMEEAATPAPPDKRIHRRRPLPPVPRAEPKKDDENQRPDEKAPPTP
jgi:hypothetical protein